MIRTRAFILKWTYFSEADRIVTVFTEEAGILTGIARGSLKMTSKITGALEPMTLVELRYVAPYGKDMVVITGCDPISSLYGTIDSLGKAAVIGVLSELTVAFNGERDPSPQFFRLLTACQAALKNGVAPALVLRYFELFTLKLSGYLPETNAIKAAPLRQLVAYFLKTHIEKATVSDHASLRSLGTYLRRIIRHTLDRPLKSYIVLQKLTSQLGRRGLNSPVKRQ